ncbi:CHAT domain-containing protein [Fomitopsis serialis]|uniref:CHAT domain-containing protein n=1 Tax=Fomitopsis serialis TaxID=139415 RepID=UPI0020078BCE|nr:CHAT domain-containing protein [Neoantrodia serialis]KAH9923033.1 CHAT domain-containing protein [Neoantrodia serialis]
MVSTGGQNKHSLHDILRKLWTKLVKPILQRLAFSVAAQDQLPHIWWCVTGPLSFLPLHAAGDYTIGEPGHKISDYVVSSYTPTLTALINARQKPLNATVAHVLDKMQTANWVHLACHGVQDSENPIESAFILHDDMLKLSKIIQQDLDKADFAFLSACQTATGDPKLSEQAVHLAAGMLFAGFRSVIATMWSIRDEDGPEVARDHSAAYALHRAVQNLRRNLLAWVPFIHIGC